MVPTSPFVGPLLKLKRVGGPEIMWSYVEEIFGP
jgi:hypothetical protein